MRFDAHYLPTYMPELDGPITEFYQRIFEQIGELERLGFDRVWVTEHHFGDYGGSIPHPPTFLSAVARTTCRLRLGVAVSVLPLHNPLEVAESYAMADIISNGRLDFVNVNDVGGYITAQVGIEQQDRTKCKRLRTSNLADGKRNGT